MPKRYPATGGRNSEERAGRGLRDLRGLSEAKTEFVASSNETGPLVKVTFGMCPS